MCEINRASTSLCFVLKQNANGEYPCNILFGFLANDEVKSNITI